ncbi:MAG: hypothetical protein JWP04_3010 [Belnapia sp.]|nr:hypothetical protein [Belnapia sp.]
MAFIPLRTASSAQFRPWFKPAVPGWPNFRAMLRAAITRRQLAAMDDRMLRDIGISRVDALQEADRLPWDVTQR